MENNLYLYLANIPAPPFDSIGFVKIYGLTMAAAIGVAVFISNQRYSKRNDGSTLVMDIFLPVVIAGIIGARVYHLFTGYNWDRDGLSGTIKLRNGGLSIWGAVIFGAVMVAYFCKKRKISFLVLGDCIAIGLLFAQALGRFGNYFNQELFGRELNAFWALNVDPLYRPIGYENVASFHPTFLYEALWCVLLAVVILVIEKKSKKWPKGATLATYIGGYCLGRTIFEYLRIDEATKVLGIRFNLMFTIVLCLSGFIWLIMLLKNNKPVELQPEK